MKIGTAKTGFVRVWDLPTRLFHWSLVALLLFSWRTAKTHEMEWHLLSGYCILGLLVFRIFWGFFGSSTARFASFVRGPRATIRYVRTIGSSHYRRSVGHNPLGAWSVLAMLAVLLAMVGTGLFAVDVDGLVSGPFADFVEFDTGREAATIHGLIFNAILVLAAVHLAAIFAYLLHKDNLIGPMITGRGRDAHGDRGPFGAAPIAALIFGIFCAVGVAYSVAHGFWLQKLL